MPSLLTILWSMSAAACFMIAIIHFFVGLHQERVNIYKYSSMMAFAAGISALLELSLLHTQSIDSYNILLLWENVAVYFILIPMIWFVHFYLQTGRMSLLVIITILWTISIVANFLTSGNLTFSEIYELQRITTFWGDEFSIPLGKENPWKYLADISSLLILIYVLEASYKKCQRGERKKAWMIGGAIIFFIIAAGIHTPMVDAEIIATPYMISFSFLAIIAMFTYQLVSDALQSYDYAHQIAISERQKSKSNEQLHQLRCQLEHLSRVKLLGELSSVLAHEINQPLSSILNNAQAAKRYLLPKTTDIKEVTEIIDDIIADTKRTTNIISRLHSMLKTGKFKSEVVEINQLITETLMLLRYELKEQGVSIIKKMAAGNLLLSLGRVEIQQVILNIITNAIKAMSPMTEKTITIITQISANDKLILSIADNGIGFSKADLEGVFKAFYIGKDTQGLGMGLTIARRIIKTHGGEIKAENIPGSGAMITFSLPLNSGTK
jgi:signal transduction histidine kinase